MAHTGIFNKTALRQLFSTIDFPAHRDELIAAASDSGAVEPFIHALLQLPKREYSNFDQVMSALNEGTGQHRPRA